MPKQATQSRREFLLLCAGVALATTAPQSAPRCRHGTRGPGEHPDPRPGIDASKVLTHDQLAENPDVIPVFDKIREIPGVVDGIRCQCGCADTPGYYSLLSCYEGEAMARHCRICQGQGRMVYRLHQAGKSLDEIRHAVDVRYG
ncbi:MAG: hypothetical protein AB7I33_07460 [Gemmatimonadales bacterium]